MIYIGCHLSISNGYAAMAETMIHMGGNTFAYFTRNPRGGKSRPITQDDAAELKTRLKAAQFGPLVAHASYTMNLCAANQQTRASSLAMLKDDLARMSNFPDNYYNFHPGSHVSQGIDKGIDLISQALNKMLSPDLPIMVLLETMAGKGSEVGSCFEELQAIIERVKLSDKIGVCFDTCHTWDAGYDLVHDFDGVLTKFDKIIGLKRLKAVHFNDSKNPCGAHKDRHELLGQGHIGLDTLKYIALHPALENLPFILETPNDAAGYIKEIALVQSWLKA